MTLGKDRILDEFLVASVRLGERPVAERLIAGKVRNRETRWVHDAESSQPI